MSSDSRSTLGALVYSYSIVLCLEYNDHPFNVVLVSFVSHMNTPHFLKCASDQQVQHLSALLISVIDLYLTPYLT